VTVIVQNNQYVYYDYERVIAAFVRTVYKYSNKPSRSLELYV